MSLIPTALGWVAEAFIGSLVGKVCNYAIQQFGVQHGVGDHLNKLENSLLTIRAFIGKAENMWIKDEILKTLLMKLKDVAYDADDLLDEFQFRILQQQIEQQGDEASKISSSSSSLPPRKKIKTSLSNVTSRLFGRGDKGDYDVIRVREIQGRLDEITAAIEKVNTLLDADDRGMKQTIISVRSTTSFTVETQVFGRDKELNELMGMLLKPAHGSGSSNNSISVLTIVGIGGVGKTTLAQLAYNDNSVGEYFQLKVWVCVSENFSMERLTKEIIESATSKKCDLMNFDKLQVELKEKIASKRFLLVLDDVWNEDSHKWERFCAPLRSGVPGSKMLVTTRSRKIADMVGNVSAIQLDGLDEENYWDFFKKCAFGSENSGDHPQLEAIAKKIVCKLNGLPLAAKTLGGLLNVEMDERQWKTIMESELWQLPQNENDVLPVLQLSYQCLPAHLKRCFAFCSLFPKDHKFDEAMLIRIWMAEGFIAAQGNTRMEDLGSKYFLELVSRCFFQKSQNGSHYEMHDLLHDLAQLISVRESYRLEDGKSQEISNMVRHLSVSSAHVKARRLLEFPGYNKLRTLMLPWTVEARRISKLLPHDLFKRLKSIQVLILVDCGLQELPETIGDLIHLRYLDISFNSGIQRLPESLCGLHNLQTLILWDCELQSLPQGMSKLINLRHISAADYIISKIKGVGKLTSLQKLSAFKVLRDHGHKLEELNGLTQLHGTLRITNLENVESEEEARQAELHNKEYLDALVLEWTSHQDSSLENDQRVLEGLRPHHALKSLTIKGYNGARTPSWLVTELLTNLETLKLGNLKRWEDVSYVGRMPHLKVLHLKGMPVVKRISHELCGPTESKFFPRLEELVLEDMMALEELPNLGQLPCLKVLCIKGNTTVVKIGHRFFGATENNWFHRLEKLELKGMAACEELPSPEQLPCLKFLRIEGMSTVKKIGHGFFGATDQGKCFPRLEELMLRDMPAWEEWSWAEGVELFPCLRVLDIVRCPKLKRLPPLPPSLTLLYLCQVGLTELPGLRQGIDANSSSMTASLSSLFIHDCSNLKNLGEGLLSHGLPNFSSIRIWGCGELVSLPVERFKELTSLLHLSIDGCPKLMSMTGNEDVDLLLPPSI